MKARSLNYGNQGALSEYGDIPLLRPKGAGKNWKNTEPLTAIRCAYSWRRANMFNKVRHLWSEFSKARLYKTFEGRGGLDLKRSRRSEGKSTGDHPWNNGSGLLVYTVTSFFNSNGQMTSRSFF